MKLGVAQMNGGMRQQNLGSKILVITGLFSWMVNHDMAWFSAVETQVVFDTVFTLSLCKFSSRCHRSLNTVDIHWNNV